MKKGEDSIREIFYLSDPGRMQDNAPEIFRAICLIASLSTLGDIFFKRAQKQELGFQPLPDDSPIHGGYGDHIVHWNPSNSFSLNATSVLMHEMMHWIHAPYLNENRAGWDYRSRLLQCIAAEAAAETAAVYSAFEIAQNPAFTAFFNRAADPDSDNGGYADLYSEFADLYAQARAENLSHDGAMRFAADETFHAYADSTPRIYQYAMMVMEEYAHEVLISDKPPFEGFKAADIYNLTAIDDAHNLINKCRMSENADDYLHDLKQVRQVFEYLELVHLARTKSLDDPAVLQRAFELEQDRNPFLGIDVDARLDALADGRKEKPHLTFFDVMQTSITPPPAAPHKKTNFSSP